MVLFFAWTVKTRIEVKIIRGLFLISHKINMQSAADLNKFSSGFSKKLFPDFEVFLNSNFLMVVTHLALKSFSYTISSNLAFSSF